MKDEIDAPPVSMNATPLPFLDGPRAHAAAAAAVGDRYVVGDCGERLRADTIVFPCWRRGPVLAAERLYRVRLRPDGQLAGCWVDPYHSLRQQAQQALADYLAGPLALPA